MTGPLTPSETDFALATACQACAIIVGDETTEEYSAGRCEDAGPLLRRVGALIATLTTERDRYRAVVEAAKELVTSDWEVTRAVGWPWAVRDLVKALTELEES